MPQRLRVFISSSGDVPAERLRAALIVDKLAQEYRRFFLLDSYRWEYEPMLASGHFQDAIELPSTADIVLLILWSRLGTPLPEQTAVRAYRGIDGRVPVTGTEWEYEDALQAACAHGTPDMLAYRNISHPPIDPLDSHARAQSLAQLEALDAFWQRHFADRGVLLAASEHYQTLEEFAQRLEQALRKLIERRIAALARDQAQTAPTWTSAPFRGLAAYEFEHAPIFFGRDGLVARAAEQLAAHAHMGTAFLLVCGPSGSGKSSLVKAALVPRLMKPQRITGMAFLRRVVFRPGDHSQDMILGLAEALTRGAPAEGVGLPELLGPGQEAHTLATHLRTAVDAPGYVFTGALGRVTQEARQRGRILAFEKAQLILVIDQLEELFTLPGISAEDRRVMICLLAGLARSGAVWVVATLRADFWHRVADMPDLLALAQGHGRLDIAAPSPAELADMIRQPMQAAGLFFERHPETNIGLDAVLAERAAAEPGVLPLLSFTLDELYRRDVTERDGRVLTYATYNVLGGLEGAIATRADETVANLAPAAQAALPRVLRTLATVGTGAEHVAVARTAPRDRFPPGSEARAVVDALTEARLLVASNEGTIPMVRFAHEALLSHWQRARDQLTIDRRDLETLALVERQQARWQQAHGRAQRQLLLRDPDLANAVDLDRRWAGELETDTRTFIHASRRRARRRQQLVTVTAIVFGLVAMIAFLAQYRAEVERARAEAERQRAETLTQEAQHRLRELYVEQGRQEWLQGDAIRALAYLSEAYQRGETGTPLRFLLKQAMRPLDAQHAVLQGHQDKVRAVVFSPDGQRLATASDDTTARVWDAASGWPLATLQGHQDKVRAVVFSPDGQRLATASDDTTAWVWDATSGRPLATLQGHQWNVQAVVFSPDGQRLATASWDNTAWVWDATSGRPLATLRGHQDKVRAVAFSPDGQRLATASDDTTAWVWDAARGRPLATLRGHQSYVEAVAFSPDGQRLATASWDHTARVWDAASGWPLATLQGHQSYVEAVAFSPDGQRLATASAVNTALAWHASGRPLAMASADNTARVWDAASGRPLATLQGHQDKVRAVVFSPDGQRLATASDDTTARVWDAASGRPLATLQGHQSNVLAVAFSPDGQRLATASADNTARVWDTASGQPLTTLQGHQETVWAVAFSPDGQRLATASADNTARVWDTASGQPLATLQGHQETVWAVAFSPDGQRLATASDDTTARVWDAARGRPLATLRGHQSNVLAVVFSPDGQRLATASAYKTARVWDVSLEIRSPEAIAALVQCKGGWRLNEGRLLPANPDPIMCPLRSPAP